MIHEAEIYALAIFGKEFVKPGIFSKEIYSILTDGFAERQICDYEAMMMPKAEDAKRIINGAKTPDIVVLRAVHPSEIRL